MYLFSLIFMLACGAKDTDTSTDTTDTSAVEDTGSEDTGSDDVDDTGSEDTDDSEDTGSDDTDDTDTSPTGDAAAGEAIVNARCMGCHGGNPSIENAANMSDAELIELFENGKGYMPAQNLTEQEALDVIAYLRATYGG